ncbi:uncharacterized protein LOC127150867 [Cucumis melo]|uniref:Uncharacterized protein LOC127150867 n=1 Tax=Cucumis melo TaxID=3656 RepID=A0ABM3L655_CUCME|nr:uncharacterized protein LOC127150867 [Cucumis melo]
MSDQVQAEYRTRLGASIDCTQFLLREGLTFRGHDETNDSKNQDESKDISSKEQMSVVLRYVDEGYVIEQFIGIIYVNNTSALSLKEAIDVCYTIIDMQLQELNNRFTKSSTELLLCMACLNPSNSFAAFDRQKLSRLARFYPRDFSAIELSMLEDQLQNYIIDMRSEFVELKSIGDLAVKMVVTKRDKVYLLVYQLLTLALILPVATVTIERTFSAMNVVKTRLRNRMEDQWMNDCLIAYIEKDLLDKLDNKLIMDRFQRMKTRKGQL